MVSMAHDNEQHKRSERDGARNLKILAFVILYAAASRVTQATIITILMSTRAIYPKRSHPNFRKLRQAAGLSQDELAFRTGVVQSRVSRAERGYLWLSPEELIRVADVLGIEVSALDAEEPMDS